MSRRKENPRRPLCCVCALMFAIFAMFAGVFVAAGLAAGDECTHEAQLTEERRGNPYGAALQGDRALVGRLSRNAWVDVFERVGGGWSNVARLTAVDGTPDDDFGTSVSLDGNRAHLFSCPSAPPPPTFRRGDSNGDGSLDLTDAEYVLNWLFVVGRPLDCTAAGDANADGILDVSDAVWVLSYLFRAGAAPAPPFPDCGPGSAADYEVPLGCASPSEDCR